MPNLISQESRSCSLFFPAEVYPFFYQFFVFHVALEKLFDIVNSSTFDGWIWATFLCEARCCCCVMMITGFKMHNDKVFSLFALCQIDPALLPQQGCPFARAFCQKKAFWKSPLGLIKFLWWQSKVGPQCICILVVKIWLFSRDEKEGPGNVVISLHTCARWC